MLIHAILLSNKYKNIEIYEKENIIGGSWAGSDFMKYSGIETGSHIFAPWGNSNLYLRSIKIIEKLIGSKMPKLTPRPTKVLNNKINALHYRALKIVYRDNKLSFEELLGKDNSVKVHHKNIHSLAIEMYKVKQDIDPLFMADILILGEIPNNSVISGLR